MKAIVLCVHCTQLSPKQGFEFLLHFLPLSCSTLCSTGLGNCPSLGVAPQLCTTTQHCQACKWAQVAGCTQRAGQRKHSNCFVCD